MKIQSTLVRALAVAAIAFFVLSLLPSVSLRASANGFSLEQVLSAPFPSDLIASPAGDKVAWVFNSQGRRNIWLAEAPGFAGRQLTAYDQDDGQEITELVFSRNGAWIAYVRGGEPNGEREVPNPTSNPAGAAQEVFLFSLAEGYFRIGEGSHPFFSPRGDQILFSRDEHLWAAPMPTVMSDALVDGKPGAHGRRSKTAGPSLLVSKHVEEPRKLFEVRGQVSAPAWSPDGGELAFVSTRGDHSFIGIYNAKQRSIRFLEPSVDRDVMPRWSADGRRIAFIRLFNVVDAYSADRDRLTPWAIRVADATTGQGKEVWRSGSSGMDSFSLLPVGDDMLQWAGERLVFASEKDGWAHLYSAPSAGGEATALTPGAYEVENVTWAADRGSVIVAANAGDIDRRHLWRINLVNGSAEQLTQGASIEMAPVAVAGGKQVAFLRSTGRDPLLPYIASADGSNIKALAPQALTSQFPSSQLAEPEQVIFKAADGLEIHGQVFKAATTSARAPAVIFMHGGPIRQMLLGWHYSYYYHNSYAMNQYLASRGYVVLSVNYRCGIGYGRAFREAKHRGARGASEYQDIVAAGKYLRARSDVDGKRIGLWGGSYGGYLTALGLARDSELFAAGFDIHGVHDWSARAGRVPGTPPDLVKLARESSPIASVDKWKSPVILVHGDDDRNVAFSQTVDLVRKLRERGVEFEELIFPDEIHDFLRHEDWLRAYHAGADFLDRRLKPQGNL